MYTSRVIGRVALGMSPNDKNEYFASIHIFNDIKKLLKYALERSLYMLPAWSWFYSSMYYTEIEALNSAKVIDTHCLKHIKRIKDQLDAKTNTNDTSNDSTTDKLSFLEILLKNNEKAVREGKEGITGTELIENVKLLFIAGSETTSTTLTWTTYYLATRNDCLVLMREELDRVCGIGEYVKNYEQYCQLKYTHAFVKETMRLKSPAAFIGLELVRGEGSMEYTCTTNGMHISGNDTIFIDIDGCLLDVVSDPDVYEDPTHFNPERWLPIGFRDNDPTIPIESPTSERIMKMEHNFLVFGSGPRLCPGMELAYMEAVIGITSIVTHVNIQLACPKEEISRILKFTAAPNKMPMIITKRTI